MKVLEFHIQEIWNWETLPNFAGKDVISCVGSQVKGNNEVIEAFKTLIAGVLLSDELCDALLDQVRTCWIGSKARQVTKQYICKLKDSKQGNTSRMGTPALRKVLDKY